MNRHTLWQIETSEYYGKREMVFIKLTGFIMCRDAEGGKSRKGLFFYGVFLFFVLLGMLEEGVWAAPLPPCFGQLGRDDSMIVVDPNGTVLFQHNAAEKRIPASTLKLVTSLAAIKNLGLEYRFKTEFYMDSNQNLTVKGYGDPLLISETWDRISAELSANIKAVNAIFVDSSYFEDAIVIPGRKYSTNPYDAPVGALCANFNTVYFRRDRHGKPVSSEPQTPLLPFAIDRIQALGTKEGRYTFSHNPHDAARYAGELLSYFLQKRGVKAGGKVLPGLVKDGDRLVHTYYSVYTLEEILRKMLEFSNNFIANQLVIAMGAREMGAPGTLAKGVNLIREYAEKTLGLHEIKVVEGSGISRENRLSARDMLVILETFKPHRTLLKREDRFYFKTGSLRGVRTRAGFYEKGEGPPYCFAIFINHKGPDAHRLMQSIKRLIMDGP